MKDGHIFLKELYAVAEGSKWLRELHPLCEITVIVDNSAVAWSLENGFTRSEIAASILQRSISCLVTEQGELQVMLVISEDNPADCPVVATRI